MINSRCNMYDGLILRSILICFSSTKGNDELIACNDDIDFSTTDLISVYDLQPIHSKEIKVFALNEKPLWFSPQILPSCPNVAVITSPCFVRVSVPCPQLTPHQSGDLAATNLSTMGQALQRTSGKESGSIKHPFIVPLPSLSPHERGRVPLCPTDPTIVLSDLSIFNKKASTLVFSEGLQTNLH